MRARVFVTLKNGVLDPQGKAVQGALESMHYQGIEGVRQGKLFELTLSDRPEEQAMAELKAMCQQLLANTVIEDYRIELVPPSEGRATEGRATEGRATEGRATEGHATDDRPTGGRS